MCVSDGKSFYLNTNFLAPEKFDPNKKFIINLNNQNLFSIKNF